MYICSMNLLTLLTIKKLSSYGNKSYLEYSNKLTPKPQPRGLTK